MCVCRYIQTYVHNSERENKIVLVSLSEGATGDGKEKENIR
jgi:hypothetical protein